MSGKGIAIVAGLFVLAFILLALGRCGYRKIDALQTLENAEAEMRRQFPRLESISHRELEAFLASGPILLVDARGEEEFAVSRLSGARNFERADEIKVFLEREGSEFDLILLYGAIGFRSAEVADELRESGQRVRHLEGGIFRWINEGNPVFDADGNQIELVHPYNRIWGRLLADEYRMSLEED
ncbi:MAG: rhodanese-like domain-containing protein [Verrucomicrobiota bacterium]